MPLVHTQIAMELLGLSSEPTLLEVFDVSGPRPLFLKIFISFAKKILRGIKKIQKSRFILIDNIEIKYLSRCWKRHRKIYWKSWENANGDIGVSMKTKDLFAFKIHNPYFAIFWPFLRISYLTWAYSILSNKTDPMEKYRNLAKLWTD